MKAAVAANRNTPMLEGMGAFAENANPSSINNAELVPD